MPLHVSMLERKPKSKSWAFNSNADFLQHWSKFVEPCSRRKEHIHALLFTAPRNQQSSPRQKAFIYILNGLWEVDTDQSNWTSKAHQLPLHARLSKETSLPFCSLLPAANDYLLCFSFLSSHVWFKFSKQMATEFNEAPQQSVGYCLPKLSFLFSSLVGYASERPLCLLSGNLCWHQTLASLFKVMVDSFALTVWNFFSRSARVRDSMFLCHRNADHDLFLWNMHSLNKD